MGSSSQTTTESTQQSSTGLKEAQPLLQDILKKATTLIPASTPTADETAAIAGLKANAGNATTYLPQVQGIASDLFAGGGMGTGAAGIRSAADTATTALNPIARGDFIDPTKNPHLQKIIEQTQGSIRNQVGSAFAGAGRSFSGAHMDALGGALSDSTARAYMDSYNSERDRQMQAAGLLPQIATGTSAALDQSAGNVMGARTAGIGVGAQATGMQDDPFLRTLEAEGLGRSLPIQNLGMLSNLVLPIAQSGRESTGQRTSTTETEANPWQVGIGAALGGLGLAGNMMSPTGALGPQGWLGSMFGTKSVQAPWSPKGVY